MLDFLLDGTTEANPAPGVETVITGTLTIAGGAIPDDAVPDGIDADDKEVADTEEAVGLVKTSRRFTTLLLLLTIGDGAIILPPPPPPLPPPPTVPVAVWVVLEA